MFHPMPSSRTLEPDTFLAAHTAQRHLGGKGTTITTVLVVGQHALWEPRVVVLRLLNASVAQVQACDRCTWALISDLPSDDVQQSIVLVKLLGHDKDAAPNALRQIDNRKGIVAAELPSGHNQRSTELR